MQILTRFKTLTFICLAIAAVSVGCQRGDGDKPIAVTRLDRAMAQYRLQDSVSRVAMRDSLAPELASLARVLEFEGTGDDDFGQWSASLPVAMFSPLADSVFQNLDDLERQLPAMMRVAGDEGLDLHERRFAAVVWGRDKSIVVDDTVMLIALNHYLGADSKAYDGWPTYRRVNKRPEMLPYDVAEAAVATRHPYDADAPTVLSRMLYEGALTEAKMRMVPDANLPDALGMTAAELADVASNREFIWNKMVGGQMLYSTDQGLIDRLFGQVPFATPIHQGAPARTARAIGYEIVRSYVDGHPDVTLAELLRPEFYAAPQTLTEAKYNPKNAPRK